MNASASGQLTPTTSKTRQTIGTEGPARGDPNAGRLIGALFLAGFATYGTGAALTNSVIDPANVIAGVAGHQTTLVLGTVLMLAVVAVDIGKAVLFFPVLGGRGRRTALAYLSGMIVETTLMAVGAVGLLSLIPLTDQVQSGATTAAVAQAVGALAVDVNTLAYQTSQAVLAVGAFFLCRYMYRTHLVPPLLAMWGAVGYILHFSGAVAELFDLHISLVLLIPGGLFEVTFGVWLLLRGVTAPSTAVLGPASN
jgi:hypothetical protein